MRLFIAMPVGSAEKALLQTQAELRKIGVRGRFSPPEKLHLTLAFLGETPDPASAVEAIKKVRVPKLKLSFGKLTLFGDALVALIAPDETLEAYARQLRDALDAAGIRYDKKAFRPHVTLAKKAALPDAVRLAAAQRGLQQAKLQTAQTILFCSDTSGETVKYTALYVQNGGGA